MPVMIRIILAFALLNLMGVEARANEHQPLTEIREAVVNYLTNEFALEGKSDLQIETAALDARLKLRKCEQPLLIKTISGSPNGGAQTLSVSCAAPQRWQIYTSAKVSWNQPVVVTRRNLTRGQAIAREHLRLEPRDITRLTRGYLTNPEELVGRQLKRNIRAGTVVQPQWLDTQKLVRRGQNVIIRANGDAIKVSMKGAAQENGAQGEVIDVKNLSSGRIIQAIVVGPGIVKVAH